MVSFQCETCGDVLTKKKLDGHLNRCWDTSFTCLDCMTQFWGDDYKGHTSCITEAQKYEGHLYKEKRSKLSESGPPTGHQPPRKTTPLPAYVTDEDDNPHSAVNAVARVEVPPAAPSPPNGLISKGSGAPPTPPVNVFDFLVDHNSRPQSPSSASTCSTCRSSGSYSDRSPSPDRIFEPTPSARTFVPPPLPPPPPAPMAPPLHHPMTHVNGSLYHHAGYVYGHGPVEPTINRFDSDLDFKMYGTPNGPQVSSTPAIQTPAPSASNNTDKLEKSEGDQSRSDKKRKRTNVEDLDLTLTKSKQERIKADKAVLHSGLTGGLKQLLGRGRRSPEMEEPSPLSPKKRSKHNRHTDHENEEEDRQRRRHKDGKKSYRNLEDDIDDRQDRRERKELRRSKYEPDGSQKKRPKAIEGRKDMKAIEYYGNHSSNGSTFQSAQKTANESHSEFFLSLIDKDYHSIKGQSIWGALKMFHEGIGTDTLDGVRRATSAQEREEKRLFKGLRVKINRQGEIVLFSRPEAEDQD